VGLAALVALPAAPLQVAIGVVVLVAVVALARGWAIADPHPAVDVVAGVATGLLNTSVGVSGPPVVMDLQGRALAKGPFRATAASVFGLNGIVALALFAVSAQVHAGIVLGAVLALPAWPVGALVGGRLHDRFPEERFRTLVLVLLALTAVVALVGALA
jgi:uncharacterized protein